MTKESELQKLINAVDTACWCWSVQKNSKRKGQVDWKLAFDELVEAFEEYQLKTSKFEAVLPEEPHHGDEGIK